MSLSSLQPVAGWFGTTITTNTSNAITIDPTYTAAILPSYSSPPPAEEKQDALSWLKGRVQEYVDAAALA